MLSTTSTPKRARQSESSGSMRQKLEETSSISSILDIPDEILRTVLSYLNARERLPVGNSCQRFKRLVFEDTELLRDLDFSKNASLTSITDIQQYFNNEEACKHVLRLNVRNVSCPKDRRQLNDFLGKAINVIDINIHGIQFKDILQLARFLNPLIRVQRLSIDWPEMKQVNVPFCLQVLQKSFSRLVYLSVNMTIHLLKVFIPSLQLCYELRKLRMVLVKPANLRTYEEVWGGETKELRNLEVVEYCGPFVVKIKELFVTMLPNPENWTDFQLCSISQPNGFHLEKNVEVCEELLASKWTERVSNPHWNYFNLGWVLFPECLLKEVLKLKYKNLPDEFCCLSTFMDGKRCLLKIEDAKRLLKNPRHQISSLYLNHQTELDCDIHLVASAFSNLTELVLCAVTKNLEEPLRDTHIERHRNSCATMASQEQYESLNLNSSFKMLVENTPHMRHFTLNGASIDRCENWDLEELYFIASWKSLKTLRLLHIPIEDGDFLIEIAKQCKHLQKLELIDLGSSVNYCYEMELLEMVKYCRDLRDFSIEATMGTPSKVLTALANNAQLRKVDVKDIGGEGTMDEWLSSIEELSYKFPKLAIFKLQMSLTHQYNKDTVNLAVIRLKRKIARPNFQIQIIYWNQLKSMRKVGTVDEDTPQPNPFRTWCFTN